LKSPADTQNVLKHVSLMRVLPGFERVFNTFLVSGTEFIR
jgi:hypothetical protein